MSPTLVHDDPTPVTAGSPDSTTPAPPPPTEPLVDQSLADEDFVAATAVTAREAMLIAATALLSSIGTGWMCSAIFAGGFPHVVAILGGVIGAGIVGVSYRSSRPVILQLLVVPTTLVVGAVLLAPYTGRGTSLPGLISQAVHNGGLQFAPVPFLPGWHFLLLLLTALTAGGATAVACAYGRARIGTFLPLPLLFAASLMQPKRGSFLSTGIGLAFIVTSLAVSYAVDMSRDSAGASFEVRRLLRAAGVMAGLGLVLVVVAQAGFLFPAAPPSAAVPPRHPELPPPVPNQLLFTVSAPTALPVRVGVLDGYAANGWETPPYDPSLLRPVTHPGPPPADASVPVAPPGGALSPASLLKVTFKIRKLTGDVVPDVAEPESFDPGTAHLAYYPRTQILQVSDNAQPGLTYVERAAAPPSAQQMEAAGPAPGALAPFTAAPPAPAAVRALLARAPTTSAFDRVQFLRTALYKAVVAKGEGVPANVSPDDVAGMLAGKTATPYQIVGAEALLSRWAGVPARIGYGYYTTKATSPGVYDVYPSNGSDWLEVYFGHLGWVPLIGQPLHAEASLANQKPAQHILPSRQLALAVYVPIRLADTEQLYKLVRWWASVLAPYVAAVILSWTFWPVLVKAARRWRRARWGRRRGAVARVLVAYAGLRDVATDLRIGSPADLPLDFLDRVAPDEEHEELAWLVTRALWGDLSRDLRIEDAEAAERMASSVTRRMVAAQSATNRLTALASRTSLRDPYSWQIPALWRQPGVDSSNRQIRGARGVLIAPTIALAVVVGAAATLIAHYSPTSHAVLPVELPPSPAPPQVEVQGQVFQLQRELSAETAYGHAGPASLVALGRVYTVRLHTAVQASLQISAFKADVNASLPAVRASILDGLGLGRMLETRLPGGLTVFAGTLPGQTVDVYFPPSGRYFDLLVAQATFANAPAVLADVINFQGDG